MGVTEDLAKFACALEFEQIPEEALVWAKDALLDCTGVALAGSREEAGRIIANHVKKAAGRPEAGVFAAGFRTAASDAALANGTMAHALDFDDYDISTWTGHPTAPLLPAIFALGQRQKASGRDVLSAYIVGFEVGGRIGAGLGHGYYEQGWHATSVLGTMGATAACCRILKLNVVQTRMALGIAGSEACGVRQNFGTMTKPLHAGLAARNGLLAALLAGEGFTADESVIEGPLGFNKVFIRGEHDPAKTTDGLGKTYLIIENGVSMKPYPCCAEGHRCLDAILFLVGKHDINADEVESVECHTSEMVSQVMIRHRPKTMEEAKFSLEYCMAVALLDRDAGLEQFTSKRVAEPRVQELLRRVRYIHPPQPTGYLYMVENPDRVTVKLHDGTAYSHEVLESKGKPENRMSKTDLIAKYRACAAQVMTQERIDRSVALLDRLEKLSDIGELMDVLCA
ncbi:MAG: MmgE/PrpD family protein [Syntrophales bacterium]